MNSDARSTSNLSGRPCDVRPTFACSVPDHAPEVILQRENYIKLLVDARVTDPECWPPGMEEVAAMIERVRDIEEECRELHGEFDPEMLSAEVQDEYMDLHLVLDAIQDNPAEEDVADLIAQTNVTIDQAKAVTGDRDTPVAVPTETAWPAFPTLQEQDNFA